MPQIRMNTAQQSNAEKLYGFLSPKTFAEEDNDYKALGQRMNLPLLRLSIGAPIDAKYAYQLRTDLGMVAMQLKFDGNLVLAQQASELRSELFNETKYQNAPVILYQNY